MTKEEFLEQIARLNVTFKNFYTPERIKSIGNIVSELPADFFRKKIDKTVWAEYPPKLDWFIKIKHDHLDNASQVIPEKPHPRDSSKYTDEQISEMFDFVKDKMRGNIL